MPWFRFIDEAKVTLRYRNGVCELTFANLGEENGWAWVAERKGKPSAQVVLVRADNMLGLRTALSVLGFPVEAGSPAEKVMRAAVKRGFAEELPDDEHWREELRRARDRAKATSNARSVYALADNYPKEVRYRDGTCHLEFARGECQNEWVFRARKSVPPKFEEIARSRYGRLTLETILRQGVCVREGSPVARLLDQLVRGGYATKRVATRGDLK